jgi:hypothetical protein
VSKVGFSVASVAQEGVAAELKSEMELGRWGMQREGIEINLK